MTSKTQFADYVPRWAHHVWAVLLGYFWHECPRCGRHFGGHEIKGMLVTAVRDGGKEIDAKATCCHGITVAGSLVSLDDEHDFWQWRAHHGPQEVHL